MPSPLLSIVIPSRRPQQLEGLLDNLEETTSDYSKVEVVVKVDDDVSGAVETMEREKARRPFRIRFVSSPRHGGVFTLWAGQNEAFEIADAQSYFFLFASDEIRILTKGWDRILQNYVGFFDDDIFRLRVSFCKYRNYHKFFDCTFMPESFALMTGRWMHVTGGTGHCWGTDAYHQCIAYHLSSGPGGDGNLWHNGGVWRDVQAHDIEFGGIDFGKDISAREHFARNLRIFREWDRLCTYGSQIHFAYLARRLSLYCQAYEMGLERFRIIDQRRQKRAVLVDSSTGEGLTAESYALSRMMIWRQNLYRRLVTAPRRMRWFLYISMRIATYPRDKLSEPLMDGDAFSDYLENNRPFLFHAARILGAVRELSPRRLMRRAGIFRAIHSCKDFIGSTAGKLMSLRRKGAGVPLFPKPRFPLAAGLESRLHPLFPLVDHLMRRVGYPVGEKARLERAFRRLLTTEHVLETFEFGKGAKQVYGSLDRLNPDLAPVTKALDEDVLSDSGIRISADKRDARPGRRPAGR